MIESAGDAFDVLRRDGIEAHGLGEVLADEAIGVFNAFPFPGGVGMGEEEL